MRLRQTVAFAVAASGDGRYLLVGGFLGVELVDTQKGETRTLPGFESLVAAVSFSPDGHFAAVGGGFARDSLSERFVRVWSLVDDTFQDIETDDEVTGVTFMPDGRILFISGRDLFRWTPGEPSADLLKEDVAGPHHHGGLYLSDDGRHLLTKKGAGEGEGVPLIHDLEDGSTREIPYSCYSVTMDRTGKIILCGREDGTIRVVPVDGGAAHLLVGHTGVVNEMIISPDGRQFASVGSDDRLLLWPMPEGEPLAHLSRERFLNVLRPLTNERIVPDDESPNGWRLDLEPRFPGWEIVPTW